MKMIVSNHIVVFLLIGVISSASLVSGKPTSKDKSGKDKITESQPNNLRGSDNSKTKTNTEALDVINAKGECVANGAGCHNHDDCCSGYCIGQKTTVVGIGVIESNLKVCVECLTDYDCPASISCANPMTVTAMCDWSSQKTFPGIDNIRKGYNIFKGDPLNFQYNKDPGWETGNVLALDYMNGATYTVMNEKLYDIPGGYEVDIDESCTYDFTSTKIETSFDFELAVDMKVKQGGSGIIKGIKLGGSFGMNAGGKFKHSRKDSRLTTRTEATCMQYNIQLDPEILPSLDGKFRTWLGIHFDENSTSASYYQLFEQRGTHVVSAANMGSMFGATLTITSKQRATLVNTYGSIEQSLSIGVPKLLGVEASYSMKYDQTTKFSLGETHETQNKFTIGSSNFKDIASWSDESKLNPEILDMEIISICDVIDDTAAINFNKEDCLDSYAPYCSNYLGIDPFDCGFITKQQGNNVRSWNDAMMTCQKNGKTLPSKRQICSKVQNALYPENWFSFGNELYTTDSTNVMRENSKKGTCSDTGVSQPALPIFEVYCVETPNEVIEYTYYGPTQKLSKKEKNAETEWKDGACDNNSISLEGTNDFGSRRAYEAELKGGDKTVELVEIKAKDVDSLDGAVFIICKDSVLMGGIGSYKGVSGCSVCTGVRYENTDSNSLVQFCSNQPNGDYLRIEWPGAGNSVGFCQMKITGGPREWYQPFADEIEPPSPDTCPVKEPSTGDSCNPSYTTEMGCGYGYSMQYPSNCSADPKCIPNSECFCESEGEDAGQWWCKSFPIMDCEGGFEEPGSYCDYCEGDKNSDPIKPPSGTPCGPSA